MWNHRFVLLRFMHSAVKIIACELMPRFIYFMNIYIYNNYSARLQRVGMSITGYNFDRFNSHEALFVFLLARVMWFKLRTIFGHFLVFDWAEIWYADLISISYIILKVPIGHFFVNWSKICSYKATCNASDLRRGACLVTDGVNFVNIC